MSATLKNLGPVSVTFVMVIWCCWSSTGQQKERFDFGSASAPPKIARSQLNPTPSEIVDRDPFRPVTKDIDSALTAPQLAATEEVIEPKIDLHKLFAGVVLDGTFERGNRRFALIDGELWEEGVPKICSADMTEPCVARIMSSNLVVIEHDGQSVELTYQY